MLPLSTPFLRSEPFFILVEMPKVEIPPILPHSLEFELSLFSNDFLINSVSLWKIMRCFYSLYQRREYIGSRRQQNEVIDQKHAGIRELAKNRLFFVEFENISNLQLYDFVFKSIDLEFLNLPNDKITIVLLTYVSNLTIFKLNISFTQYSAVLFISLACLDFLELAVLIET